MRNILILAKREFGAYFNSPVAYIVATVFLLLQGYIFWLILSLLSSPQFPVAQNAMEIFFGGTFYYWLSLLVIPSFITMRSFAEEKKSGTIETLLTAPISDFSVVMGKFLAAWRFFITLWFPTFVYIFILNHHTSIDMGPIYTGYAGTFLIGAVFVSIGIFTSSLTKNQLVAAITSFLILMGFFSLGFLGYFADTELSRSIISYFSFADHFADSFAIGIIDSRNIIFYISLTVVMIYLTVLVLGTRKIK